MTARTCLAWVLVLAGFAVGATVVAAQVEREFINPAGGYTHVVTVKDRGVKTIYGSGQVGSGADLQAHAESAFQGVADQLEAAGAMPADLVKVIYYLPGYTPGKTGIAGAREANAVPTDDLPASTLLGIQSLLVANRSMRTAITREVRPTSGR